MSDFVVRIDTAKLDDKQAARVAAAIQGAVLAELGNLDLAPPAAPVGTLIFHPEWRGMWLRSLHDLQVAKQPILTVQTR